MNCWKIVDAGDYKKYGKDFLIFYTNNLDKFNHCNHFWAQFIPTYYDEYLKNNKSFRDGLSRFGEINEIAFLTVNGNTSIHIDHVIGLNKNIKARLNIPLLNCEKSYTAFYHFSPEIFNRYKVTLPGVKYQNYISQGSTKYWSFSDIDNVKPFTKVELIQPTILRTSYPHNVICEGNKFPRITLTISFKNDIIKFLEE
jgi:hypothetical protein